MFPFVFSHLIAVTGLATQGLAMNKAYYILVIDHTFCLVIQMCGLPVLICNIINHVRYLVQQGDTCLSAGGRQGCVAGCRPVQEPAMSPTGCSRPEAGCIGGGQAETTQAQHTAGPAEGRVDPAEVCHGVREAAAAAYTTAAPGGAEMHGGADVGCLGGL